MPPETDAINVPDPSRRTDSDALHELRVPLTVCRGHLELLLRDPARSDTVLPMVLDELDRMARLVDDLGVLAGADQPDFLRPVPVDLAALTDELLAKAASLGRRRWSVESRADSEVVCDPHRVTQAVLALADNAVRHTEPGSSVILGSEMGHAGARLWVEDSGHGVAAVDRERIFERFFRGAEARGRYRGAGLGLAVARAIARAHGGDVEVPGRAGCGATFILTLPHRR